MVLRSRDCVCRLVHVTLTAGRGRSVSVRKAYSFHDGRKRLCRDCDSDQQDQQIPEKVRAILQLQSGSLMRKG